MARAQGARAQMALAFAERVNDFETVAFGL